MFRPGLNPICSTIFALVIASMPILASASGEVRGVLLGSDLATPIGSARVILRGESRQGRFTAETDPDGRFQFGDIPDGRYRVRVGGGSYSIAPLEITVSDVEPVQLSLHALTTIAQLKSKAPPRRLAPTKHELFTNSQTQVALDKNIIAAQAPLAGSEQLLAAAPGVNQVSYGSTGAAKGMISLRGFKQGWANNAGVADNGLFGVTLNGVYLNNPQSGIWEPDEVPDLSIISGSQITFGPGNPDTRTFDSLGGTVDFYSILPAKSGTVRASSTAGSFGGAGYHVDYSRSLSKNVSVLLAQGRTFSQGFRDIYGSGNAGPGSTYGTFGEVQDSFHRGTALLFAYGANGTDYRPNLVPLSPLVSSVNPEQVVTVNGFDLNGNPIPGPAYSQQTTGYYSALPLSVWQKTDQNSTRLIGFDFTYDVGHGQYLTNQAWYRHGDRLHVKSFNFDQDNNTALNEYNNPYSNATGDSLAYHIHQGKNDYALGFNLLYSHYETRNSFWNSDPIASAPNPPTALLEPSNFRNNDFYMTSLAFFAQDDIAFTDKLEVIPGLRSVSLATNFENNGLLAFPACADPSSVCYGNNHTSQPNSTTLFKGAEPSMAVRYKLGRDVAAYASYARGLRSPATSPGGPYQRVSVQGLAPEISTDNEAGLKFYKRLAGVNIDGSPRENFATASLFDSYVYNQTIPISIGQGLKVSSASGSSHYAGFTLAGNWDMRRDLQAFGSYSVTHATFLNYVNGGTSYSGLPVTQTPINTANLGLVLSVPSGGNMFTGRLYDQFVGPQAMWNNNLGMPDPTGLQIPSYNLVNGSIAFHLGSKAAPLGISVNVTNLLNRKYNPFEYVSAGAYFAGGAGQSVLYGVNQILADPGPPREVQVTLSFGG